MRSGRVHKRTYNQLPHVLRRQLALALYAALPQPLQDVCRREGPDKIEWDVDWRKEHGLQHSPFRTAAQQLHEDAKVNGDQDLVEYLSFVDNPGDRKNFLKVKKAMKQWFERFYAKDKEYVAGDEVKNKRRFTADIAGLDDSQWLKAKEELLSMWEDRHGNMRCFADVAHNIEVRSKENQSLPPEQHNVVLATLLEIVGLTVC